MDITRVFIVLEGVEGKIKKLTIKTPDALHHPQCHLPHSLSISLSLPISDYPPFLSVSSLLLSYLLHEYLGFTPSFSHAVLRGVPSGMSIFFPFDVSTVMRRDDDPPRATSAGMAPDDERRTTTENARAVDPRMRRAVNSRRAEDINENLGIFELILLRYASALVG